MLFQFPTKDRVSGKDQLDDLALGERHSHFPSLAGKSLSILKHPYLWLSAAIILTVISAVLTSPRVFGFARSAALKDISSGSGYLYSARFPKRLRNPPQRRILPADRPALTENGNPLLHPNAGRKAIARDGEGRFRISGTMVSFSSSDQTSPIENGRRYVITVSAFRAPEWLLLVLWTAAFAAWVTTLVGFRSHLRRAWAALIEGLVSLRRAFGMVNDLVAKRPRLVTFAHLLLILMFAWLIYYNSRGEFPIQGDCVVALEPAYSLEVGLTRSVLGSLRARAYLPTSQNILYHWFGDSYAKVEVLFMLLFLLSAVVWYAVLRHLFHRSAALLGSLFFLGYAGKYETLTWFAAGMYVVVMLLCVLIFGVTRLQITPALQLLLICSILWLSLICYEVLIMILPVFPIIFLGRCLLEKRPPGARDWSLAFVPAVPVLIHLLILAGAKNPLWTRAKLDVSYYSLPLQEKVVLGFRNALNQSFGQPHFDQVAHGVASFFRHVVPANPNILSLFIVAVLGLTAILLFGGSKAPAQRPPSHHVYGIAGLYLALFAGTITFILGPFTPSRMTFLPSFGLSLLLAYLTHQALRGSMTSGRRGGVPPLGWIAAGAVAAICVAECLTLSSIIKQAESARAFDQVITDQIREIQPSIPQGSEVFVAMTVPLNSRNGFWRDVASSYQYGNAFAPLWYVYQSGINQITYSHAVRSPEDPPDEGLFRLAERYANSDRRRVFPFVVNEDLSVMGIRSVTISNKDGAVVNELSFPSMENAKADRLISARIAQR
jgi:hypothetical protein